MTFQISRRGKQYLKTAQTLRRAARTMTDSAIADQLKVLADDDQRRAKKASDHDAANNHLHNGVNRVYLEGSWLDGLYCSLEV
jgi:hypothetical protein